MRQKSRMDGSEAGFYVVANVESAHARTGVSILEGDDGQTTFRSLSDARDVCRRIRQWSGNRSIYVYALVGIEDALRDFPNDFE